MGLDGENGLRYEIFQNAYIKLVLHSIKHSSYSVNGVLIGRISDGNIIEISDSVPLFHNHLGLLTPLEISLIMIEEHYAAQGLGIVGYFHANERSGDLELGNLAKNIGNHICRYFPQAAIFLLDNKKLEALPKAEDQDPIMQLYVRDAASKSWKQTVLDRLIMKEPAANTVLSDYISSKKWQDIVDLDEHLDDISKDWLNQDLFQ